MLQVLMTLNALCSSHDNWTYRVRDHEQLNLEYYNIDLYLGYGERLVISNTGYEEYVEVWCNTHPTHEDGFRVKKSALLEYLIYIIKEEYDM